MYLYVSYIICGNLVCFQADEASSVESEDDEDNTDRDLLELVGHTSFLTHTHTHTPLRQRATSFLAAHTHIHTHTHARAHAHTHAHTSPPPPPTHQWYNAPRGDDQHMTPLKHCALLGSQPGAQRERPLLAQGHVLADRHATFARWSLGDSCRTPFLRGAFGSCVCSPVQTP